MVLCLIPKRRGEVCLLYSVQHSSLKANAIKFQVRVKPLFVAMEILIGSLYYWLDTEQEREGSV